MAGHIDQPFVLRFFLLNLTSQAEHHLLHQFQLWRVLLKEPSKPPSSVTNWSSSIRQYSLDIYRVLSCYHPSEAPRHSRPIYQRLGQNVHFRITIPYGYQFQEKDVEEEVGGPPRPADAGVPVTRSRERGLLTCSQVERVECCLCGSGNGRGLLVGLGDLCDPSGGDAALLDGVRDVQARL